MQSISEILLSISQCGIMYNGLSRSISEIHKDVGGTLGSQQQQQLKGFVVVVVVAAVVVVFAVVVVVVVVVRVVVVA